MSLGYRHVIAPFGPSSSGFTGFRAYELGVGFGSEVFGLCSCKAQHVNGIWQEDCWVVLYGKARSMLEQVSSAVPEVWGFSF